MSDLAYCIAIVRVALLATSVSKLPRTNNATLRQVVTKSLISCSAQTLRRVSSLVVVLRKRVDFTELASVKRIGGSCEPMAR